MKPVRKTDSTCQSCSCTSCIYISESEQPSIRKYTARGSRLDRLYYGKYIPLRERNFLNRFVRIRAVYDDLRDRIIYDSTLSLDKNADLRPRKHYPKIKLLESSEKSGAILEMGDCIDKVAALGEKKLSECCSYCNCSSNVKMLESVKKEHRHKRVYARTYVGEYDPIRQDRTGKQAYAGIYKNENRQTVHGRMGERYNKRRIHFKARHIRSDPCTSTLKFCSLIKTHSKAVIRKVRHVPLEEPIFNTKEEPAIKKPKLCNLATKSYHKYKDLHDKLESDLRKLNESRVYIKQNLQPNIKKSLEQAKQVKNKVKTNIESGLRKSIQAVKALQPKYRTFEPVEYPETTFKIKKDSLLKFEDYLKRKEMLKDWECNFECNLDTCVPEECFKVIKLRRSQKRNRRRDRAHALKYEIINQEDKVEGLQLRKSSSSVQAKEYAKTTATHPRKYKPMLRVEARNKVMGQRLIFETKEVNKVDLKDGNQKIVDNSEIVPDSKTSGSNQPPGTHQSNQKIRRHAPRRKRKKVHRHHKGSQVIFKSSSELSQDSLNVIPKKHKARMIETNKCGAVPMSSQQRQLVTDVSSSALLPFECEPFMCKPGVSDPQECVKQLSIVKTNTNYRSVSSFENKSILATADKNVSKEVQRKERLSQVSLIPTHQESAKNEIFSSQKQAVRISSTFSFNVEFYKKGIQDELKAHSTRGTGQNNRSKRIYISPKLGKIKGTSTRVYKQAKSTVRRCYSTLKLHKNMKTEKFIQTSLGTVTSLGSRKAVPSMIDRDVESKKKHRLKLKKHTLLPYECEPGVCIPGERDPILCKNILKLRNGPRIRHNSKGSYTSSRETKSTSSIVSRSAATVKAKIVQSSIAPTKPGKTSFPRRRYKNNFKLDRNDLKKTYIDVPGRQAVRVGSSFSFNIEFSKQPPQEVQLSKYQDKKPSELHPKIYKNKGIKVTKVRIDHVDTQALEPRKHHKVSLVRPMLKRCFSILNLKKKTKRYHTVSSMLSTRDKFYPPNIFTVSTAMTTKTEIISPKLGFQEVAEMRPFHPTNKRISISTSSFQLKKSGPNSLSQYSSFKLGPAVQIPIKLKQPLKINSSLSLDVKIIRDLNTCNMSGLWHIKLPVKITSCACVDERLHECKKVGIQPCNYNHNKITGISRYLDTFLCAMNVKISNEGDPTGRILRNKLKRYECEPGICIAGECNPYDCQKTIKRRLARNVHKVSGTKPTYKSISSYATSYEESGSKSTQYRRRIRKHSRETARYKDQRHHETKQRQAIRVGSSFSFRSKVTGAYIRKPLNCTGVRREVQSKKTPSGKHGQSQLTTTSMHRATYTPMIKRCFCTQKLRRKGRIHREHVKLNTLSTKKPPSIESKNVKVGTANVKYHNIPTVNLHDLKPYECEPGIICKCYPYKCLERMKRKKDLGINTSRFDYRSISNMTSEGYLKLKTRAVGAKPRKAYNKTTGSMKNIKINESIYLPIVERSSRQAVRIGSNFSFNIEFYKGTPHNVTVPEIKETVRQDQRMKKLGICLRQKDHKKELKGSQRYSQSSKSVTSRDTQMERPYNQASTMTTSSVRCCFCTAKLQDIEIPNRRNTTTLMHKYLRLLGLRNKEAKDYRSENKRIGTAEKRTNTNYYKNKVHLPPLEPNKCEPGKCVHGQCYPYLCHKILQRRSAKLCSKRSETESVIIQSVCSGFGSFNRPRNQKTQVLLQKHYKQKKNLTKNKLSAGKSTVNADKRLVRIGSNFSLNVEFYKVGEKVEKPRAGKMYPSIDVQNIKMAKRNRFKSTGTESVGPAVRSYETQSTKKEASTFASSPPLKRNFFTLKLLNRRPTNRFDKPKKMKKIDTKSIETTRTAKTQSHKQFKGQPIQKYHDRENISSCECEPFIYVPGGCNPVECLERIRKRPVQTKNLGTITEYANRKSMGTFATRKRRDENLQVKFTSAATKHKKNISIIKKTSKVNSSDQTRQAVRIGSNFSFNIEFLKDTGNDASKIVTHHPLGQAHLKQYSKKPLKCHKKVQPSTLRHNEDSQSVSTRMQATETGMAHSKGCICTLQSRNKAHNNKALKTTPDKLNIGDQPRSKHSIIEQFLKKCVCAFKFNKVGKLQDRSLTHAVIYEIKGTSTQSRNPRDHRTKKSIRTLHSQECVPSVCVPGECDPYEDLERIQKRQFRDFGTDYKRYLKDSATDSIRGKKTRSTDAQCIQKRKCSSHGSSTDANRGRLNKESNKYSANTLYNPNRQVVRVGSNFSFNVEFFKDHGQPVAENKDYSELRSYKVSKFKTTSERLRVNSKGSGSKGRGQRCQRSQCPYLKRRLTSSAANTAPKRCFSTLKLLQKSDNTRLEEKPLQPLKRTENKMTKSKVKYAVPREMGVYECPSLMCIPGECNPYKCLDKMRKRGIIRKSRNIGTRAGNTSTVSLGKCTSKVRYHKMQSHFVKEKNIARHSELQSILWKSPGMYQNRQNKRAVRIGSNYKFNVEFFKEKSQPLVIRRQKIVRTRGNEKDLKSCLCKSVTSRAGKFRHHNSKMDEIETKNLSSDAAKILKRCFCTLQLQSVTRQKNINGPEINVRYPQSFTVKRVVVESCNKNILLRKEDRCKESKSINLKSLDNVKTVATKTDKKYLRMKELVSLQFDLNSCPDYNNGKFFGRKTKNDLQTILPYTPSKFNKKQSKVLVSDKGKLEEIRDSMQNKREDDHKKRDTLMFGKGKRLTANKSIKSIPKNNLETKSSFNSSFLCRCAKFFCRRTETSPVDRNNKFTFENQRPEMKLTIKPQNAKYATLPKSIVSDNYPAVCPKTTDETRKPILKHKRGFAVNHETVKLDAEHSKSQGARKSAIKHSKMRVTFADHSKNSSSHMHRRKFFQNKSSTRSRFCYSCSVNDCPLNSDNKNDPKVSGVFRLLENTWIKSLKKAITHSESAEDFQYCECCKRKIDVEEISKGGGDRRLTISSYERKIDTCPCDNGSLIGNGKKTLQKKSTAEKKCVDEKPLFEIQIDSVNSDIVNKDDLFKNLNQIDSTAFQKGATQFTKSKSNHSYSCTCCKCIRKRQTQGAEILATTK